MRDAIELPAALARVGRRRRAGRRQPSAAPAVDAPARHVRGDRRRRCCDAADRASWLGHRGKGQLAASTAANVGRALPSFAVLVFFSTYLGLNVGNLVFAMVLLAVPPIFTNTYVGIRQVDRDVVDAARGMGLTERQLARTRRAAARPAARLRRHPHLGRQRAGDRDARPLRRASTRSASRSSTRTCTATPGASGTAILVAAARDRGGAALRRACSARSRRADSSSPSNAPHRGGTDTCDRAACSRCSRSSSWPSGWPPAAATTTRATAALVRRHHRRDDPAAAAVAKVITEQRRQRQQADDHDRLQELHRGVHPRRDLRPGAAGRRLQGQEAAEPRLRADRAQGPEVRPRRRLPGVHRHGADELLQGQDRRRAQGPGAGVRPDQGRSSPRSASRRSTPTPFTDSNGFAMTQEGAQKAGNATKLSDLQGQGAVADARRAAGVRAAPGLQARPREGLQAEVQDVQVDRPGQAPRGAQERPGRRVAGLHHRRPDQGRQPGPAQGRQVAVPALQRVADRQDLGRRRRRARTSRRRSTPVTKGLTHRGHAGAQLPRGPRQGDARQGGAGEYLKEAGYLQ